MITSASNPRLRLVRKLASRRQRDKLGLFACEGEDLVGAGLDAGLEPVEALVDAERPALADRLRGAEQVAPRLLAEVSVLGHPPRVIAVFRRADLPRGADGSGLALWRVSDPGNVGTLLRTADAVGGAFVALSAGCADPTSPKALRASAGAVFRVPTAAFDKAPRPWLGLVPSNGTPLWEVEKRETMTLLLGSERIGLPAELVDASDEVVSIPLVGTTESLNVAVAGALALYELSRPR